MPTMVSQQPRRELLALQVSLLRCLPLVGIVATNTLVFSTIVAAQHTSAFSAIIAANTSTLTVEITQCSH